MGEPLLCPNCKKGTMIWVDPYQEDILDSGIMQCCDCGAIYNGIPEWSKAMGFDLGEE